MNNESPEGGHNPPLRVPYKPKINNIMKKGLFFNRSKRSLGFCRNSRGFTLMELLIVIGLLAALATLVMSGLEFTRTEALDDSLVQKELSDLQRVFQRFVADCVPQQSDYKLIAKYGLAPLMQYDDFLDGSDTWSFNEWDRDRRKGWRGPYADYETEELVNITLDAHGIPTTPGQERAAGGSAVPVICTPYVHDDDGFDGGYYRVIPAVNSTTHEVEQLWVVFPSHSGALVLASSTADDPAGVRDLPYKRRLILDN